MLRGALLGAGNIARNGHLPAYLRSPEVAERLSIVAVADYCGDNLAAIGRDLPHARLYSDVEALLDAERLDFVDICAPPYAHRALLEAAVSRGCHVLCEKPLATDLEEALAIRRTIAASSVVVLPCHQYHYAPQWLAVRAAIQDGEIGELREGRLTVQRVGANAGAVGWRPGWRTDRNLAGGGILVDHGAHLFYQLHSVLGSPHELSCVTEQRLGCHNVDDTASVTLEYDLATVHIDLTWAASSRCSSHRYTGTKGEIRCLDDRVEIENAAGVRTVGFPSGLSHGSAHSEWFAPLLLDFAARIESQDSRLDRLDEAVSVARYITTAYASAARGGRPEQWRSRDPAIETLALSAAD